VRFRWPGARIAVPVIVSTGKAHTAGGLRQRATIVDRSRDIIDPDCIREALRARSLRRREGLVWDAYAGDDRAPFGWENRA